MAEDSSSFLFVHAADLHLDTPFKGLHGLSPRIAESLKEASLLAFDAVCELAIDAGAAFVVFAGDIYDGAERGLRAQLRFHDGLERLSAAGISSFVVHGNHDPLGGGWSAVTSWPEQVTIFPSGHVEVVPVVRDGATIATVQGVSYEKAATTENLSRLFHRPGKEGFHIGLLHCNVEGSPGEHANYSPCTLADLKATGLDYLALGHVHQRRVLAGTPGVHGPFVVYAGNTQARMAKWTEEEPKGAYLVTVRDGLVEALDFVACDRVRFVEAELDLDGLEDLAELDEALGELRESELAASDGRSVVARVRLVGRGPLHATLARRGVLDELLLRLRIEDEDAEPFFWWDGLVDHSAAVLDLDEIRRRDDFASDMLALLDELAADPEKTRQLLVELAAGAPGVLAPRLSELVGGERLDDILAGASSLALELLDLEA